MGQSLLLLNAWLAAMFIASAARLIDYQNRTLELSRCGLLVYAGFAGLVMSVLSVIPVRYPLGSLLAGKQLKPLRSARLFGFGFLVDTQLRAVINNSDLALREGYLDVVFAQGFPDDEQQI